MTPPWGDDLPRRFIGNFPQYVDVFQRPFLHDPHPCRLDAVDDQHRIVEAPQVLAQQRVGVPASIYRIGNQLGSTRQAKA